MQNAEAGFGFWLRVRTRILAGAAEVTLALTPTIHNGFRAETGQPTIFGCRQSRLRQVSGVAGAFLYGMGAGGLEIYGRTTADDLLVKLLGHAPVASDLMPNALGLDLNCRFRVDSN